jgi:N-methylhydantoinase A/oxoprolinase/acetone carboxylase beta subunit
LTARGPRPPVEFRAAATNGTDPGVAVKNARNVYFGRPETGLREYPTSVYDRYSLVPGMGLVGPAIVEERESTTVIGPGMRGSVDAYNNLVVHL